MIEVTITAKGGNLELARIRIENVGGNEEFGNYSVHFAVNRAMTAVGLHQRGFDNFPRTRYNVLALLRQALNTLDEKELELEDGVGSADMEREQTVKLPELGGAIDEGSSSRKHLRFGRRWGL